MEPRHSYSLPTTPLRRISQWTRVSLQEYSASSPSSPVARRQARPPRPVGERDKDGFSWLARAVTLEVPDGAEEPLVAADDGDACELPGGDDAANAD